MGNRTVQPQPAGSGRDHLPSNGPGAITAQLSVVRFSFSKGGSDGNSLKLIFVVEKRPV